MPLRIEQIGTILWQARRVRRKDTRRPPKTGHDRRTEGMSINYSSVYFRCSFSRSCVQSSSFPVCPSIYWIEFLGRVPDRCSFCIVFCLVWSGGPDSSGGGDNTQEVEDRWAILWTSKDHDEWTGDDDERGASVVPVLLLQARWQRGIELRIESTRERQTDRQKHCGLKEKDQIDILLNISCSPVRLLLFFLLIRSLTFLLIKFSRVVVCLESYHIVLYHVPKNNRLLCYYSRPHHRLSAKNVKPPTAGR